MSISSCPRCAKQITVPTGVNSYAKVRCPLCNAQYPLAEALVNMPPALEVVEDLTAPAQGDWQGMAAANPLHDVEQHDVEQLADMPLETRPVEAGDASDELDLEAGVIEHDDVVMEDKDTEVEELGFITSDPLEGGPAARDPLVADGTDDESVWDFQEPTSEPAPGTEAHTEESSGEEIELDFGDGEPVAELVASEDSVAFDFGDEPAAEKEPAGEFDFMETSAEEPASEGETALDFIEPDTTEKSAGGDEIELDFGEPLAVESVAAVSEGSAETSADSASNAGKKKPDKKKKEKAPREPKPAGAKGRGRSMITALLSVLIVVPLTLYGMVWVSPEYDFLGMRKALPWAFAAQKKIAKAPVFSPPPAAQDAAPTAQETPTPTNVAADAAVREAVAPAEVQAPAATPPDDTSPTAQAAATEEMPVKSTGEPVAPPASVAAEPKAKEPPASATAKEDSIDSLIGNDAPAADKPDEMPAKIADSPADPAAEPALSAQADATEKPALDLGEPPAPATAAADEPDPFATTPEESKPAETVESPAEILGPRNAPTFTPEDVVKAQQAFLQANQKVSEAQASNNQAEIPKARKDYYLNLYRLAEAATFATNDTSQPQFDNQSPELQALVGGFAGDKKRLDALKFNGPRWLAFGKRTNSGIVLAGKVQSVAPIAKLFQFQLELNPETPPVTVVTATDPQLKPGDEAFVLGSIVEHPANDLAGYQGDAAVVVWSGAAMKIPAK